jgi:hypothetical protein
MDKSHNERCFVMHKIVLPLTVVFFAAMALAFLPNVGKADIEWKVIRNLELNSTPLDVAPSADGQRLFILTPGEILVYSIQQGKITDRLSVGKEFDRIVALPRPDALTVLSSRKKIVQVITLESIYKINVTGLPSKGPRDAPVTLVVFDDYQ